MHGENHEYSNVRTKSGLSRSFSKMDSQRTLGVLLKIVDLIISNSQFHNNCTDGDGGAIKSTDRLRIRKSILNENISHR